MIDWKVAQKITHGMTFYFCEFIFIYFKDNFAKFRKHQLLFLNEILQTSYLFGSYHWFFLRT